MKRWECNQCDFIAWTDDDQEIEYVVKSHLLAHYQSNIRKSDFRTTWHCPFCQTEQTNYDKEEAIEKFKSHLYDHIDNSATDNTHIADQFSWNGNIQIKGPIEADKTGTVRTHFHAAADLAILVTANPAARIQLLYNELDEWPSRTVVLSTDGHPFDKTTELDFSGVSIELVELDPRLRPTDIGETISRVIDMHQTPEMTTSVEVSILDNMIESFSLNPSCEFVRMLSARMEDINGVFQLYVDPDTNPNVATALNFLEDEIDFTISAKNGRIVRTK